MNSITNWQCIASIFSLNFINVNKCKRMRKLQNIIINGKKTQKTPTIVLTPEAALTV